MSRLNRFRWVSSVLALIFTILGAIGTALRMYVLEAICIVALFVVFFSDRYQKQMPGLQTQSPHTSSAFTGGRVLPGLRKKN